jgi:cysteinyl-tRNA synthetase
VVAYLSIGEAEDYRPYWRKQWDADKDGRPDALAPDFLLAVNPDWVGNYRVKYWSKDWQAIIGVCADEIVAQGFDGMYLDIVDGFEFFEFDPVKKDWIDDRKNPETGNTYRQDMIAWASSLATMARAKASRDFLVIPQNGVQLLADKTFLETIDAVGVEDLFTNGNKKQPRQDIANRLRHLANAEKAHKPILLIEYGTSAKARAISQQGAREHGLTLLLTDRGLTGKDLQGPGGGN